MRCLLYFGEFKSFVYYYLNEFVINWCLKGLYEVVFIG